MENKLKLTMKSIQDWGLRGIGREVSAGSRNTDSNWLEVAEWGGREKCWLIAGRIE